MRYSLREEAVLITGAAGEVGLSLIDHFRKEGGRRIIALDLNPLPDCLAEADDVFPVQGDITDKSLIEALFSAHHIRKVFHLAAILSSTGEKHPFLAHDVNVNGSFHLLQAAHNQSQVSGEPVLFIFPSSIAVYGIPSLEEKRRAGAVREEEFLAPVTMYGVNKLYIENVGRYLATDYGLLEPQPPAARLDFRCVRLPGLLSTETIPSGGTSDYASQMVHACAQHTPYACFASAGIKIPFMAMADAVSALITLARCPRERLSQTTYNISGFSATVEEIRREIDEAYPDAEFSYDPDTRREHILNTWPEDTDDSKARADWGWNPQYSFKKCFQEYLIPGIQKKYQ